MQTIQNLAYGKHPAQLMDVYIPDGKVSSVFLYFHGGGLEAGDKKSMEKVFPFLVKRGVAVVSANYRMYPEAKYPDYLIDAAEAVAWTKRYAQEELECSTLYVGGSSAGGYISMMLCFDCRYLAGVGLDNSAVCGYFHDAGQPTAHFNVLKNRGVDPRRVIVDETAPLYYIGMEESYPPMRFIVSDRDMENRLEQTQLVLSTMKHFGYTHYDCVLMEGTHCEYCGKLDEQGDSVLGQMIYDFILSCSK